MIYRSNIEAPDLQSQFAATTICKVRPWSMGHDVMSDAVYEPECGFMLHDEAAILYECSRRVKGTWVDIGSRLGWSYAHIRKAGCEVIGVDPAYKADPFLDRFEENIKTFGGDYRIYGDTSTAFFEKGIQVEEQDGTVASLQAGGKQFDGICIDGNHDAPEPLNDARNALAHLKETGVIILHDFWGQPVRDAVNFLIDAGLKCRIYSTPNGMAVCWRGDFEAPDHNPDPAINWAEVRSGRAPEFDFSRTV
jgi:hypothetical protein